MESYFARQELVLDKDTGRRIKQTKVLVVGAGAGGNEVLKNLALMGFGHFTIVDYDPIEPSNLSRTTLFSKEDIGKSKAQVAADVLKKLSLHDSPNINAFNSRIQDVGKQVFLDHDIIISCVDTNSARAYINDWCVKLKKPFFEMGFDRFVIQICFFPNEKKSDACLREIIGYGDFSGQRQSCSKLKMDDAKLQHIPTIQVSSAFAGVFVAAEIILFLQGNSQLKNKVLQYSAEHHLFSVFEVLQSDNCAIHKNNDFVILEPGLKNTITVEHLLKHLKSVANEEFLFKLEDEFIISMSCEGCEEELSINKFSQNVYDRERWCKRCLDESKYEEVPISKPWIRVKELNLVNKNYAVHLEKKLSDFLVKARDLIRVDALYDTSKIYLVKIDE